MARGDRGIRQGLMRYVIKIIIKKLKKRLDKPKKNMYNTSMFCGCSSMVELQPSKLTTWVRFPSFAPLNNITLYEGFFVS